jgi:hypothetical protein
LLTKPEGYGTSVTLFRVWREAGSLDRVVLRCDMPGRDGPDEPSQILD